MIDQALLNQLVPVVIEQTGRSERAFDIFLEELANKYV